MKIIWWIVSLPFKIIARIISWFWRRTRKSYTSREDHVVESEQGLRSLLWEIKSGKDDDNGNED